MYVCRKVKNSQARTGHGKNGGIGMSDYARRRFSSFLASAVTSQRACARVYPALGEMSLTPHSRWGVGGGGESSQARVPVMRDDIDSWSRPRLAERLSVVGLRVRMSRATPVRS